MTTANQISPPVAASANPPRKRIFLNQPQNFYLDVVTQLAHRGVDVVLVCNSDDEGVQAFRKVLPDSELISHFGSMGAAVPPTIVDRMKPPSYDDLCYMADWEADALQMIDRLNYHALSVQELRWFYLRYISIWAAQLDRHRPDGVVFHGTPHAGYDFVLYQLCKRRNIPTLMVERMYLNNCMFFRHQLDESVQPSAEEIIAHSDEAATEEEKAATDQSQWVEANRTLNDLRSIKHDLSWRGMFGHIFRPGRFIDSWRRFSSASHALTGERPRLIKFRFREILGRLDARKCFRFYESKCERPQPGEQYVVCMLHFQPERSTVPDGGRLSSQLHMIQSVAAALPAGWKLYVKEHPRQFRQTVLWKKARSMEFYKRLAAVPNVRLMSIEESSAALIAGSRAVTTITGTAGWEAVQHGTPAIVFGNAWYVHSPGVFRVTDSNDCRKVLEQIASNEATVDPALVRGYVKAIRAKHSFLGCFEDRMLDQSVLSRDENATNYAEAIVGELPPADVQV